MQRTSHVLEIVTLKAEGNQRLQVVLKREEILNALGREKVTAHADGWHSIELDKEELLESWLRFGMPKRTLETRLAGCTVQKRYSLGELGVANTRELLEKFFDKPEAEPNGWWRKRDSPEVNRVREPDLVATLKAHGFEVAQGELAPWILARPR